MPEDPLDVLDKMMEEAWARDVTDPMVNGPWRGRMEDALAALATEIGERNANCCGCGWPNEIIDRLTRDRQVKS